MLAKKAESPAKGTVSNESPNPRISICSSTGQSEGVTTSMMVPVIVHLQSNPDIKVNVYALLDDCNDATFFTSSTLKQLGVQGLEISLTLNMMHGNTEIPVQKNKGLVPQSLGEAASVDLPKAY